MRKQLAVFILLAVLGLTSTASDSLFAQQRGRTAQTPPPQEGVATTGGNSAGELTPDDEAKLKEAAEKFNQADIQGALDILKVIAQNNPKVIPSHLVLAQWFAQQGNQAAVRVSLEKAVDEAPNDPEAYVLLGEAALTQGELAAADLLFQRGESLIQAGALTEKRQRVLTIRLLKNQAQLNLFRQQWTKTQGYLSSLLKIEGETPETCRTIARTFFELDKESAAYDWFARADQLDLGKGLPADAQMALLYREKGDTTKAAESMKKALNANPGSLSTQKLSLTNALNDNDLQAAAEAANRLYSADAKNPETLKLCAVTALYREDFATAEKIYREALAIAPEDTDVVNGLALALCEQNDPNRLKLAQQYAAANVKRQANNRDFLTTLGWVLYKSGETDQALQILQQAVADGRMISTTAYYLAVIKNSQGDKESAKKFLQLSLSNPSPFSKRTAAEVLLKQLN